MNYLSDVNLADFLEDLIGSQILKREKEEAEKEKNKKIEKIKDILDRRAMVLELHMPLKGDVVEELKNYCLNNDEKFVMEDCVFDKKRRGHFTTLNVYMIYNGYAVIENFRYLQWKSWLHSTKRRNYYVVWLEGYTLKWQAISGQLYREMRNDFLNEKNPIERFLKWRKSGKEIAVWDFLK